MGGSSGARSINNAVVKIAGQLIEHYQVIHLTGYLDWDALRQKLKIWARVTRSFHTFTKWGLP